MANTKMTVYRFGEFELNPRARELKRDGEVIDLTASVFDCLVYLIEHRERPVGRDELIAAVWATTSVSENLVAQAIARLRRALGDDANEPRCIKTLPRIGYRWMMETSVVSAGDDPVTALNDRTPLDTSDSPPPVVSPWSRRWRWIAPLLMLIVAAAGLGLWWMSRPSLVAFNPGTTAVLPARIDAPEEWSWLRLGLMDLIAGDMRDAKVPVENSQTVLNLLGQGNEDTARLSPYALVIHPQVTLSEDRWHVELEATAPNGRTLHAESSSDNVMKAAHSASAFLLAQMGASALGSVKSTDEKAQYLLRMDAASDAGSMNVLRELIDKAPPDLRETLEFSFIKATFYCDQGEYDPCKKELTDLLQRLPADKEPILRGQALSHLWYVYFREHKYAEGIAALSEAIRLFQTHNSRGHLAYAYAERAGLLVMEGKFDQAESDYGLARINYAWVGDTAGALGMDAALADLDMRRGHFAQALPTIQHAYEQYQRMGMRQYLPGLLYDLVISQKMLLQHPDALATTERYWPIDQKQWEFMEEMTRHLLTFQRAAALAGSGRSMEGSKLLEQLLAQIKLDPHGEPGLQATVYVLLAKLALRRGETKVAQTWISQALSGQLLEWDSNKHDHAEARLTQALIAQQANDSTQIKRVVADMQTWANQLSASDQDEWIAILLLRAQSVQANAEGHREQALDQLKLAMSKASHLGVPELMVDVGLAYTLALLEDGKVNEATAVSGRLSTWEQLDWRAAWAQACLYRALGSMDAWKQHQRKAAELAGDRVLPMCTSISTQ